jgi:hypothetical protein
MRSSLLERPGTATPEGPTLAELVGASIAAVREFDSGKRDALYRAIGRTMTGVGSHGSEFVVPTTIARSLLPDTPRETITRTGVGFPASGPGGYGDTLAVGYSPFVADRQRHTFGPLDMINWWPVKTREYKFPVVAETSLANGSRYSGFNASWEGTAETTVPAAVDSAVGQMTFVQNRLLIQTTVSRDVFEDSESLERWLSTIAFSEIRNKLEQALLFGVTNGFLGILNEPSTVTVSKGSATSGQILAANLQSMWSALSEGDSETAVWHCNKGTVQVLDALAASGTFPPNIYFPAGASPTGTRYSTLFGKPLIPLPWCAAAGNPGDIFCVNWNACVMTYLRMNASPLSFSVTIPDDSFHNGIKGLKEGAIEQRASQEALFSTDLVAILWKMRCDFHPLWNTTSKSYNGNVIGPASVIQQR